MVRNYIILFAFICLSCGRNNTNQEVLQTLPGKIAIISDNDDTCSIYDSKSKSQFQFALNVQEHTFYRSLIWANKGDSFFAVQCSKNPNGPSKRGSIVLLNLSGNVARKIYESDENESIGIAYPSTNDKLLLIETSDLREENGNPLWGLTRIESISIMDLNEMKIIKKIPNIGKIPNFYLSESPWLFNDKSFIYTVTGTNKIFINDTMINPEKDSAGIYKYDLLTDKKTLIIPDGSLAVCSPIDNNIAYIRDHSLWVQNIYSQKAIRLFRGNSKTGFTHVHWTPDGKCIYIYYWKKSLIGTVTINEKLLDVSTGDEKLFKRNIIGVGSYTWK